MSETSYSVFTKNVHFFFSVSRGHTACCVSHGDDHRTPNFEIKENIMLLKLIEIVF